MFLNSGLKVSPPIESCVKTLKRQFNVMMYTLTHGSRLLRDNERKMILCDQVIFEGWVNVNIEFFLSCIFLIYLFVNFYSTTWCIGILSCFQYIMYFICLNVTYIYTNCMNGACYYFYKFFLREILVATTFNKLLSAI